MVITAAGDSSTQRGGGIGKSLVWENVVSPSNQVTVIVSTTNKHVHISFYGTISFMQRRYVTLLLLLYLSNIMKYAIETGNIIQVTLLTNVTRYLNNIVTVTSLILRNIITTSNEVTNLISNPLSNA